MQRPLLGTHIQDLDTPCLLVDLDALEHNLETAAAFYRDLQCKIRPHVKNHGSPHLAHMQIMAGGTVEGVCVSKVAEGEVMVYGGIRNILVTNQVVSKDKIARLCELCQYADVTVACDDAQNARALSIGAGVAGVEIGVVIEVETGTLGRAGVRSPGEGLDLARSILRLPGLRFRGVMSHEVPGNDRDEQTRQMYGRDVIGRCIAVRKAIESAGIAAGMVSTGETWTWNIAPGIEGVTEVELGSYLLMDFGYTYVRDFKIAASVLARVVSKPRANVAVGDVGSRALGLNRGMPTVLEPAGIKVEAIEPDRILLRLSTDQLGIGDTFRVAPGNQDTMVSRWDQYVAIRGMNVQAVWDIAGRGCFN